MESYKVKLTTSDGSVFSINNTKDLKKAAGEVLRAARSRRKLPKTCEKFKATTRDGVLVVVIN